MITIASCCMNQKNDKKIINSFLKEIIINNDSKVENIFNFLHIQKERSTKERKFITDTIIDENIKYLKKELKNSRNEYVVLSDSQTKEQLIDPNFVYEDYSHVYHLIIDRKVITSFIIDKNKIVSFSYNIIKNKDSKNTPLIL